MTTNGAERARTVLRAAAGVAVRVSGASPAPVLLHAAADDGSVLMLLDAGAELVRRCGADPGMVALVEAVDVCPVPVPDRVRARVWLGGSLRLAATNSVSTDPAGPAASRLLERLPDSAAHPWAQLAVLHLAPTAIALGRGDEARTCAERVRWEDYVAADPDPLVDVEAGWLCHLIDQHEHELDQLGRLLPVQLDPLDDLLVPVGLDRYGLTLRIRPREPRRRTVAGRDLRLAFGTPVRCPADVPGQMVALLGAARARR